jgi:hypothetical protein
MKELPGRHERGNQGITMEAMKRENMMQVTRYIFSPPHPVLLLPRRSRNCHSIPLRYRVHMESAGVSSTSSRKDKNPASDGKLPDMGFPDVAGRKGTFSLLLCLWI